MYSTIVIIIIAIIIITFATTDLLSLIKSKLSEYCYVGQSKIDKIITSDTERFTGDLDSVWGIANTYPNLDNQISPKDLRYTDELPYHLLPIDNESVAWLQQYPTGEKSLEGKSILTAGKALRVDTQGSSLRNGNQQLRSEPPNPIIPFSNRTAMPDPWFDNKNTIP